LKLFTSVSSGFIDTKLIKHLLKEERDVDYWARHIFGFQKTNELKDLAKRNEQVIKKFGDSLI